MKKSLSAHTIVSVTTLRVIGDMAATPMHVELARQRREAVHVSGRRSKRAARGGREQRPGLGSGVERVQVVEKACQQWG